MTTIPDAFETLAKSGDVRLDDRYGLPHVDDGSIVATAEDRLVRSHHGRPATPRREIGDHSMGGESSVTVLATR